VKPPPVILMKIRTKLGPVADHLYTLQHIYVQELSIETTGKSWLQHGVNSWPGLGLVMMQEMTLIDNMLLEGVKRGVGLSSWRHAYSGEKSGCSLRTARPMGPVRYTAGHGKYLPRSLTHCKHNDNENVCIIAARTHIHVDRIHQLYGCWFYLCQVEDVRHGARNVWFVSVAFEEPSY
jgi:hypothetical protein